MPTKLIRIPIPSLQDVEMDPLWLVIQLQIVFFLREMSRLNPVRWRTGGVGSQTRYIEHNLWLSIKNKFGLPARDFLDYFSRQLVWLHRLLAHSKVQSLPAMTPKKPQSIPKRPTTQLIRLFPNLTNLRFSAMRQDVALVEIAYKVTWLQANWRNMSL